ncbi:hypothetical protein M885DRAFT_506535 [Pelagophyceae sp. CCMP2097]|nr:hypothetical protein M885DRAFT_506535 [Pelagophyceae sp. CCMP2097]
MKGKPGRSWIEVIGCSDEAFADAGGTRRNKALFSGGIYATPEGYKVDGKRQRFLCVGAPLDEYKTVEMHLDGREPLPPAYAAFIGGIEASGRVSKTMSDMYAEAGIAMAPVPAPAPAPAAFAPPREARQAHVHGSLGLEEVRQRHRRYRGRCETRPVCEKAQEGRRDGRGGRGRPLKFTS